MAQFIVRVYPAPVGFRVVVDGVAEFDVTGEGEIEAAARGAILDRLRAFLPPRAPPPADPASAATLLFDIALVRVASQSRGAPHRRVSRG